MSLWDFWYYSGIFQQLCFVVIPDLRSLLRSAVVKMGIPSTTTLPLDEFDLMYWTRCLSWSQILFYNFYSLILLMWETSLRYHDERSTKPQLVDLINVALNWLIDGVSVFVIQRWLLIEFFLLVSNEVLDTDANNNSNLFSNIWIPVIHIQQPSNCWEHHINAIRSVKIRFKWFENSFCWIRFVSTQTNWIQFFF